jgi:peptidoglycan hydrolase-like protein with peptidoglycan-binding domain
MQGVARAVYAGSSSVKIHMATIAAVGLLVTLPALAQTTTPQAPQTTTGQDPQNMPKAQIQQVQKTLTEFGYSPGNADGVWTPESAQALAQFQANRALPTTKGLIDQTTASALHLKM